MDQSIITSQHVSSMSAFGTGVGTVLLIGLVSFLVSLYRARTVKLKLRRQGLVSNATVQHPFGHLLFCYKITSAVPKDAHPNYLPDLIRRALPDLGPVYYLDTWPFGSQMLVVASPDSLYQVTQKHSLPKFHAMKAFFHPITEGLDIVIMEGDSWKRWRGIFNPGFSASHLMTMTSAIVEETIVFCDLLHARLLDQKTFRMKDLTDFLALDIIGRVVMDTKLDSQKRRNPLVDGLRMQIRWLTFGADVNPIERYNPIRPFVHLFNAWRMNRYVSWELDSRMADFETVKPTKSIMDLALTAYLAENPTLNVSKEMDGTFKRFAMSQIKLVFVLRTRYYCRSLKRDVDFQEQV